RTLARLAARSASLRAILPGHGPELAEPPAVFSRFLAHRREREAQIVAALEPGGATLPELVATIYRAYPRSLWPAAGRQVLAHLSALADEGRVRAEPLAREPTATESAILRPDPSAASDPAAAAVAAAELGYDAGPPFARYALV
ncbi:MAG: hypothetical protein ACREM2_06650, partial [Vulcanimicrobiaceae bacterium]